MFPSARSDPRQMMRQVAESEFRDDSSDDDDEDVDASSSRGATGRSSEQQQQQQQQQIKLAEIKDFSAKDAARATNCVGYIVLCVLVFSGVFLSVLTHFYVLGQEEAEFRDGFNITGTDLLNAVDRNAATIEQSLDTLARLFSAAADADVDRAIADGVSPPVPPSLVTVHDWEAFAHVTREYTGTRSLAYTPLLLDEAERVQWETYSVGFQEWIADANAIHTAGGGENDGDGFPPIRAKVWAHSSSSSSNNNNNSNSNNVDPGDGAIIDPGPGPYTPIWQTSPPPMDTTIVNFNLASNLTLVGEWIGYNNGTGTFLSEVLWDYFLLGYKNYAGDLSTRAAPSSLAFVPVAPSLVSPSETPPMGFIVADIPWTAFFRNTLSLDQQEVNAVVDSCGSLHSYTISPAGAEFLGTGDLHDQSYSDFVVQGTLGTFTTGTRISKVPCTHTIRVYPTAANENVYESKTPYVFAVGAAVCFFFAIVLFLVYDCFVRYQQNRVVGEAEKSQALVASLFPKQVARRLFESNRSDGQSVLDQSNHSAHLLNFVSKSEKKMSSSSNPLHERPIAELFPEATVMFADIAGFTAWSSIREPTHVFLLLESIFQAFDEEARKAGVFKVETVGDCYVAVCGVPEACSDHAEVMANFARECLYQFNRVVRGLELTLGPDTGDLAMRIGLNSGPVTAGVLRGERARFQLFGDTVNTASRIETTGQRDRVHVSEHTAKFLQAAGRGDWLVRREDAVQAKGKGLINTFWLILGDNERLDHSEVGAPSEEASELSPSAEYNDHSTTASDKEKNSSNVQKSTILKSMDAGNTRKVERLVAWNTELLLQLLKHIVARRKASSSRRMTNIALTAMAQTISTGGMVVDEVTEIIQLPDFDDRLTAKKIDASTVTLPPDVVSQTRRFVSLIASMYRDNPFHNFEHASHVTMSVSKLLSRIVAPNIDKETLSTAKQHEALILHDHTYGITSDPLTQFSVVLSALIHDVDHRGVPNFILAEEDKYLASVYENKSIAEQNSVDLAWNTLMEDEFEALRTTIFADISELKRFRQLLVNSVIATDIFDKELSALRKKRWTKAFSVEKSARTAKDIHRMATIVIEHLIQASDVAHTMQHWHVYRKWNERLFCEMYDAYTSGRSKKDPSDGWYKGEIWFFDNYIIPLAKKLKECGVFGVSSDEYLNYAMENRQEWEAKGESIVASLLEKYGSAAAGSSIGLEL